MKNVLNYQSSEYDCGPTSLTNALRYLFDRDDIRPELLKAISLYTLDAYGENGECGMRGTSSMVMQYLVGWFNQYGRSRNFPISAAFVRRAEIAPGGEIVRCLHAGGAVVVRCWLGGDPHYVLLTRALGEEIGLFDPYAVPRGMISERHPFGEGVRIVEHEPAVMNRIVRASVLNDRERINYAMGKPDEREAILLFNRQHDTPTADGVCGGNSSPSKTRIRRLWSEYNNR